MIDIQARQRLVVDVELKNWDELNTHCGRYYFFIFFLFVLVLLSNQTAGRGSPETGIRFPCRPIPTVREPVRKVTGGGRGELTSAALLKYFLTGRYLQPRDRAILSFVPTPTTSRCGKLESGKRRTAGLDGFPANMTRKPRWSLLRSDQVALP